MRGRQQHEHARSGDWYDSVAAERASANPVTSEASDDRKDRLFQASQERCASLARWSWAAALGRPGVPSVYVDVVDEERGRVRRLVDRPTATERKVNERIQRAVKLGGSRLTPDLLAVEKEN